MYVKTKHSKGMLFYPTFVLNDAVVIFAFMAVFSVAVFFFPESLFTGDSEIPADPLNTPDHIKPEWYFLASYQFLKLIPEIAALALQTLGMLAFVLLPFLDRSKETDIRKRPLFLLLVVSLVTLFIGLTLWGAKS